MPLTIYREKQGLDIIDSSDNYFINTILRDDEFTHKVLRFIDQARRVDDVRFEGRSSSFGPLDKSHLSTGTKTILNIAQHPDKCFNVVECGDNALNMLRYLHSGMVYWEYPIFCLDDEDGIDDVSSCDFVYRNERYTDVNDFLEVIENEG